MTYLITGGAGFIGSNFVYHMLARKRGDRIVCVDKLTYAGNRSTLREAEKSSRFAFYRADICDRAAMGEIFERERPSAVVNFAAESHVDRSIARPEIFLRTNVLGTQTLLDLCLTFGVERYHQVSTDEVYGDLPLGRPDLSFKEDSPLRASSPYSASKAGGDLLVNAYCRTYGLFTTVSRCSNNYGPLQFPEKLVPLVITKALKGEPVPVYGTGENVRDWIFVEDHCRAIDLILQGGKKGEVYNVGGRGERSNLSLIRLILEKLGREDAPVVFVEDRKGHDLRYSVNAGKAERELGWRPSVPLEEGISRTVEWYLGHREWWEKVLSGAYLEENERAG